MVPPHPVARRLALVCWAGAAAMAAAAGGASQHHLGTEAQTGALAADHAGAAAAADSAGAAATEACTGQLAAAGEGHERKGGEKAARGSEARARPSKKVLAAIMAAGVLNAKAFSVSPRSASHLSLSKNLEDMAAEISGMKDRVDAFPIDETSVNSPFPPLSKDNGDDIQAINDEVVHDRSKANVRMEELDKYCDNLVWKRKAKHGMSAILRGKLSGTSTDIEVEVIGKDNSDASRRAAYDTASWRKKSQKDRGDDGIVLVHKVLPDLPDSGFPKDTPIFIITEAGDKSLRDFMDEKGAGILEIPPSQKLHILVDVLTGLIEMQRDDRQHRGIEPENIQLFGVQADSVERAKLAGFVRAGKFASDPLGDDAWAAQTSYLAPEVLDKDDDQRKSDVFSLGVVAYELFLGSLPTRTGTGVVDLGHDEKFQAFKRENKGAATLIEHMVLTNQWGRWNLDRCKDEAQRTLKRLKRRVELGKGERDPSKRQRLEDTFPGLDFNAIERRLEKSFANRI